MRFNQIYASSMDGGTGGGVLTGLVLVQPLELVRGCMCTVSDVSFPVPGRLTLLKAHVGRLGSAFRSICVKLETQSEVSTCGDRSRSKCLSPQYNLTLSNSCWGIYRPPPRSLDAPCSNRTMHLGCFFKQASANPEVKGGNSVNRHSCQPAIETCCTFNSRLGRVVCD